MSPEQAPNDAASNNMSIAVIPHFTSRKKQAVLLFKLMLVNSKTHFQNHNYTPLPRVSKHSFKLKISFNLKGFMLQIMLALIVIEYYLGIIF